VALLLVVSGRANEDIIFPFGLAFQLDIFHAWIGRGCSGAGQESCGQPDLIVIKTNMAQLLETAWL